MTSTDESLPTSFKDNFSYIAAFLSALVGLAAFKNEAESYTLYIIRWDFTIIEIALPFMVCMILAAYIGALAIQSRAMNFTLFPLTKGLEWTANTSALIGLTYPIFVLLVYLFTLIATQITQGIPTTGNPELAQLLISSISTTLAAAVILRLVAQISSNKLKGLYKDKSRELLIEYAKMLDMGKTTSTTDILTQQNILASLVKGVLSLKGYSVGGNDLLRMSQKLVDLNIFSRADLHKIKAIQSTYDTISRGAPLSTKATIKELGKSIDDLAVKLRDVVIKNT